MYSIWGWLRSYTPTTFTYSSTTSLVGRWVVRAGGAGLGGRCGSPGAWTAALALDLLPGMSHEREAPTTCSL